MKINKKITSAVLALAMITSSFSGLMPIGGKLSASAAYDADMQDHDFIFKIGTDVTNGWVMEEGLTITQETFPNTQALLIRVEGKATPKVADETDTIMLEILEVLTNHGSRSTVEAGVNDWNTGHPTTDMYFHNTGVEKDKFSIAVNAGSLGSFAGEKTLTARLSVSFGTIANSTTVKFNVKDGVIQYPKVKLPVTASAKTGLNADIIGANGKVSASQLIKVSEAGYNGTLSLAGTTNLPTGIALDGTTGLTIATSVSLPQTINLAVSAPSTADYAAIPTTQIAVTIAKGDQKLNETLIHDALAQAGEYQLPTYTSDKAAKFGTRAPVTLGTTGVTGTLTTVDVINGKATWSTNPIGSGVITVPVTIAVDNFYNALSENIRINVTALPEQTVTITAPTEVEYKGANVTTAVKAVAATTGAAAGTAPGAISYAINPAAPTIATIDATTGVITWLGYGSVTVEAKAAGTTESAEGSATQAIERKKLALTLTSKDAKVGKTGPASIDTLVSSTVVAPDTLEGLNAYNVTYKLAADASAPEIALDFAAAKDLAEGEYSFTATPNLTEIDNYNPVVETTGKFTVAPPSTSSSDDEFLTVFYEVGSTGSIISGASSEQVVKGSKPKHMPTIEGTAGFTHTGWSLNGSSVDPSTVVINSNTTFKAVYNDEILKPEVPSDLKFDKEIKESYIKGDTEGTFRPDASITRAEFSAIISRVLNKKMPTDQSTGTNFADISSDAWYAKEVAFVQSLGLINGYQDGTFRPEESITRAEATTIIMRVERTQGELITGTLTDISGNWAEKEIIAAYANGLISGYPDGTFRPDHRITRAETIKMINNVLDIKSTEVKDVFTDINGHWAAGEITAAATMKSVEATN